MFRPGRRDELHDVFIGIAFHQLNFHVPGDETVIHLTDEDVLRHLQPLDIERGRIEQLEAINRIDAKRLKHRVQKALSTEKRDIRASFNEQLDRPFGYERMTRDSIRNSELVTFLDERCDDLFVDVFKRFRRLVDRIERLEVHSFRLEFVDDRMVPCP